MKDPKLAISLMFILIILFTIFNIWYTWRLIEQRERFIKTCGNFTPVIVAELKELPICRCNSTNTTEKYLNNDVINTK